MIFQVVLLLGLLGLCSFSPGFYLVRKLRWSPPEKLCGAVALSLLLLFVVSWGIYCVVPGGLRRASCGVVTAGCLVLALLAHRDLARLFRAVRVRRMVLGYGFLLLFTLVFLATIRNYSGMGWVSDWTEHFQRTLFFLHRFPTDTPLLFDYQLPARPPMMNVLAAFFLAQTQDSFALAQVVFTFLNTLLFLPCCLMLPALGVSRRIRILPLVALFAASPVVFENATYLWTKSLAAFYVVVALWFYVAAIRKKDWLRMAAAFVAVSGGLLVHYSAGPYLVFLTVHYLFILWKRPQRWKELATITVACGLLLGTWFCWSMATYGAKKTFQSNTSVTAAQKYEGSAPVRIASNFADSLVPFVLRGRLPSQANSAGQVRDYAFSFYQMNLIFSMGLVGGPLVLWLLYRIARKRPPEWRVWRVLIPVCVVIGIAVVGERDPVGSAHLTLIPLEVLGISMVAAAFPWRRAMAVAVVAGCLVDFSLGVWLQARIQSLENVPGKRIFTAAAIEGAIQPGPPTPDRLSAPATENWLLKHRFELIQEFLAKVKAAPVDTPENQKVAAYVQGRLERDLREDVIHWKGWWVRHQYRLRFLGDEFSVMADPLPLFAGVLSGLLLAALLWELRGPRFKTAPASLNADQPLRSGKRPVRR